MCWQAPLPCGIAQQDRPEKQRQRGGSIVRTKSGFLGNEINDAPALTAATVRIAFSRNSDITAEAAGAAIMETSLQKVDELLHASWRLRTIALQNAVGGIVLSLIGMLFAAAG